MGTAPQIKQTMLVRCDVKFNCGSSFPSPQSSGFTLDQVDQNRWVPPHSGKSPRPVGKVDTSSPHNALDHILCEVHRPSTDCSVWRSLFRPLLFACIFSPTRVSWFNREELSAEVGSWMHGQQPYIAREIRFSRLQHNGRA